MLTPALCILHVGFFPSGRRVAGEGDDAPEGGLQGRARGERVDAAAAEGPGRPACGGQFGLHIHGHHVK